MTGIFSYLMPSLRASQPHRPSCTAKAIIILSLSLLGLLALYICRQDLWFHYLTLHDSLSHLSIFALKSLSSFPVQYTTTNTHRQAHRYTPHTQKKSKQKQSTPLEFRFWVLKLILYGWILLVDNTR